MGFSLKKVVNKASSSLSSAAKTLTSVPVKVSSVPVKAIPAISTTSVSNSLSAVTKPVSHLSSTATRFASTQLTSLSKVPVKAVTYTGEKLEEGGSAIIRGTGNAVTDLFSSAADLVGGTVSKLASSLFGGMGKYVLIGGGSLLGYSLLTKRKE